MIDIPVEKPSFIVVRLLPQLAVCKPQAHTDNRRMSVAKEPWDKAFIYLSGSLPNEPPT